MIPVPPDLERRLEMIAERVLQRYISSGPLRNARISGGNGLTVSGGGEIVVDGGALRLVSNDGTTFYVGPLLPAKADGSAQQGAALYREDGTLAMALFDPEPTGSFRQFLAIYDRLTNIVLSDDTDAGEGLARAWVPLPVPVPTAIASWPNTANTTAASIAESQCELQHPKVWWNATTTADPGVTGTVQLQITYGTGTVVQGAVHPVSSAAGYINEVITLPGGFFGNAAIIDVLGAVTGGTGKIYCQTWTLYGRQT